MITKKEDKVFIAFAGSDDMLDWVENSDIKKSFIHKLRITVHHGFWNSMTECWKQVASNLEVLYKPGDKIIITGHSKGAAIGFCLRLKLIQQEYPKKDIKFYGFATPRVIKEESEGRYNICYSGGVTLFEVEGDPVCKLPREYMGYVTVCDYKKVAKRPWYLKVYLVRAINHKLKTYVEKFSHLVIL